MENLVSPARPGAEEFSADETRLAAAVGSHNLAAAARGIERSLPTSRQPMLAETLSQLERKVEFDRMAGHVGSNLARAAMAMRLPK